MKTSGDRQAEFRRSHYHTHQQARQKQNGKSPAHRCKQDRLPIGEAQDEEEEASFCSSLPLALRLAHELSLADHCTTEWENSFGLLDCLFGQKAFYDVLKGDHAGVIQANSLLSKNSCAALTEYSHPEIGDCS